MSQEQNQPVSVIFHADRYSCLPDVGLVKNWLELSPSVAWTLGPAATSPSTPFTAEQKIHYAELVSLIGEPLSCQECLWKIKGSTLVLVPASVSTMEGTFSQILGLTLRHNYLWGWLPVTSLEKAKRTPLRICRFLNRTARLMRLPMPEHPVFISHSIATNFGTLDWSRAKSFASPIVYRAQLLMASVDTRYLPSARTSRFDRCKVFPFGFRFRALKYALGLKLMDRESKGQQDRVFISTK